jgi:broad specificity phosphatase PhoE
MKVIFVRHGETHANTKGVFYTGGNGPTALLTQRGRQQAQKLTEDLKNESIEQIICSPLKRTRQTAETINQLHQAPIKIDPRITDTFIDPNYAGKSVKLHQDFLRKNFWDGRLGKSETKKEETARIKDFINDLKGEYKREGTVLVVTHEAPLQIIKAILEKGEYGPEDYFSNSISNCQKLVYSL